MGVNLCRGDTGMPQHFLYRSQIGPALYQMRCKGMSEGMRRNGFLNPCRTSQVSYNVKNHYAGD